MTQIFGPANVYVELQRHGERAEEARNQAALRIADSLHLPILATNGVRYATGEEREILDVFTAIRHGVSLEKCGPPARRQLTASPAFSTRHAPPLRGSP